VVALLLLNNKLMIRRVAAPGMVVLSILVTV